MAIIYNIADESIVVISRQKIVKNLLLKALYKFKK